MLRYSRNKNLMSDDEIILLSQKKVCVLGLGGLGGYIVEMLSRIGVGSLTLVDGDVFDETNLNRQLFSSMNNLGSSKALEAEKRVRGINPLTKVIPVYEFIDSSNAMKIIATIKAIDRHPFSYSSSSDGVFSLYQSNGCFDFISHSFLSPF